jgi:hypothetical protein
MSTYDHPSLFDAVPKPDHCGSMKEDWHAYHDKLLPPQEFSYQISDRWYRSKVPRCALVEWKAYGAMVYSAAITRG